MMILLVLLVSAPEDVQYAGPPIVPHGVVTECHSVSRLLSPMAGPGLNS